jgi:hydrogenase large subunit
MRGLNPFTGPLYLEALHMSRLTREMFCLMEGRHVHPSTFFYEALPGYEAVGRRRVLLGCWGAFQDPVACDFRYETMTRWGRAMYVTPGIVVDGKLLTTDLVDINHPWNQTTLPKPQKRDFAGRYTWVMSPRWFDAQSQSHLALDSGGGPLARLWVTALAGLVDIGTVKATGQSIKIFLPRTAALPETELEWKIPRWANTLERNRAPTYFQAYAAAAALFFVERGMKEVYEGRTQTWAPFEVPAEAVGCGFHEAVRATCSSPTSRCPTRTATSSCAA